MSYMRSSEAPKDAIIVSKQEAIMRQWGLINEWIPKSDVWAIRFGCVVAGLSSLVTGFYTNWYYRKKLKIGTIGYTSSYLPMVLVPTLSSFIMHKQMITSNIITQTEACPVCVEVKAIAIHCGCGTLYPLLLGPVTSYMIASTYNTCRIPMINIETKKLWKFHLETSKPLYRKIPLFLLINLIPAVAITYMEFENFNTILQKLDQVERELNSDL
ncbi:transmembrane protein 126 [Arctopsyche grandis]|uniref:transmembrane protein 126 n=1 Tax=Arctopsyche grandis TaxID=121162 RepID=UPI00406D961A